jgi:hypothetical protein
MMEEEVKILAEEPKKEEVRPVRKSGRFNRGLHDIIGGDLLSKGVILRNLPYVVFLAFLAMVYIGNTYYSEKTFKQIEKIKNELKELRYRSISAKSRMLDVGKQTEIARKVERIGIRGTTSPPYKIYYSKSHVEKVTDSLQKR